MSVVVAILQWAVLLVLRILIILAGLVMVAVAIPYRVPGKSVSDGRNIVNLPWWAWLWGNDYDGLLGDNQAAGQPVRNPIQPVPLPDLCRRQDDARSSLQDYA